MRRGKHFLMAVGVLAVMVASTATAQSNYALDFDGDDVVEVSDPVIVTGALTVEAWILARTTTQAGRIVSNRSGGSGFEIVVYDPGAGAEFGFALNATWRGRASFDSFMNTWVHVAATWLGPSGAETRLYINGQMVATGWTDEALVPGGPLSIGRMGSSEGFFFDGLIDEVRVWEAALDGTTIADWMNREITPDHPDYDDLAGYWRFDEGSGQVASSEVFSPDVDGQLGLSGVPDAQDPLWMASGATPVREISVGQLKERYRE